MPYNQSKKAAKRIEFNVLTCEITSMFLDILQDMVYILTCDQAHKK